MRRWGAPSDFAGIAVYLASADSRYTTGDVITIDGGYHSLLMGAFGAVSAWRPI